MPFESHIKAVETFRDNQNEIVLNIVSDFEKFIIDMNRQQLFTGMLTDYKDIEPAYRPFTVKKKKAKGQPYKRVTLKDTGDFYGDFYIEYGPKHFEIGSEDEKTLSLIAKYTDKIFGLTDDHLYELIKKIKPELQKEFRQLVCA